MLNDYDYMYDKNEVVGERLDRKFKKRKNIVTSRRSYQIQIRAIRLQQEKQFQTPSDGSSDTESDSIAISRITHDYEIEIPDAELSFENLIHLIQLDHTIL